MTKGGWGGIRCPAPHCSSHLNNHCLSHLNDQGWGVGCPTPHCSSHFTVNSWWPRVSGVGVGCPASHSSSLLISLKWPRVGGWGWGVLLLIAPHCSSHLTVNSWWPRVGGLGVGWPAPHCSSLLISLKWLRVCGVGVLVSCSSLLISLNCQLMMTKGAGWGVLLIVHLTNQIDCSSAVKRNWLPSLYANTA